MGGGPDMKIRLKKYGSEYRIYKNGELADTAKTLAEAKQKALKLMMKEQK
jgi:hypothetical protein